jgi:hypothetical protein
MDRVEHGFVDGTEFAGDDDRLSATRVSQATLAVASRARKASRMASEIWSASLSGWPSATDSEVNK